MAIFYSAVFTTIIRTPKILVRGGRCNIITSHLSIWTPHYMTASVPLACTMVGRCSAISAFIQIISTCSCIAMSNIYMIYYYLYLEVLDYFWAQDSFKKRFSTLPRLHITGFKLYALGCAVRSQLKVNVWYECLEES